MRLLAISDIHDNIEAVRRLRWLENNRFDAIVVAGDLGNDSAAKILKILDTFKCPVMYVLGNWDHEVGYDISLSASAEHLHINPVLIDGFCFVGFSGCSENWGNNPIANFIKAQFNERHAAVIAKRREMFAMGWSERKLEGQLKKLAKTQEGRAYEADEHTFDATVRRLNVERAINLWTATRIHAKRTIFVSHARITRLQESFPGLGLHLFGHRHGFKDTTYCDIRFINVSALDNCRIVFPKIESPQNANDPLRNFNFGTYTAIEYSNTAGISAKSHRLWADESGLIISRYKLHKGETVHSKGELFSEFPND